MPEEQINEFAIYGTPEDVLRQKESLEDGGIQYLLLIWIRLENLKALNTFANEIIKKS